MPKHAAPSWVITLRDGVSDALGKGYSVGPARSGKIRLQHRVNTPAGVKTSSVELPYRWAQADYLDALMRVRKAADSITSGMTLAAAFQEANAASSQATYDWAAAVQDFYRFKSAHGNGIAPQTWQSKYAPVLRRIVDLMAGPGAPTNATLLLEAATAHWELGSRARQVAAQSAAAFLRRCVSAHGFNAQQWTPPANTREVVGRLKPKREQYALSDAQLLRLLEGLPNDDEGNRWRFAIQLAATYGLRPIEIFRLKVMGGELWTVHAKKSGGGTTRPRKLLALPVRDIDGPLEWNLQGRLAIGEKLPQVAEPELAGDRMGRYLRRQPIWRQLQQEAEAEGFELVPYACRHRYAAEGHRLNLPPKFLAALMGHSLEVHTRVYARFSDGDDIAAAVAAALAQAAPGQPKAAQPVL
jgi:integrase